MLSRTARLAAILTITSAAFTLFAPRPAVAASGFSCGDTGPHFCCAPSSVCASGIFCCYSDAATRSLGPDIVPVCGCG